MLWCVALAFDYGAPLLGGGRGWRVSPAHFAERHGLIVIIALGEAIISLGVGAEGLELDAGVVAGAALGLLTAFCLWWLYFDASMAHAEHKLRSLDGEARNRLARDSYSYLHLPIVAGVVLFALAAKKTLAHVAEPLHDLGLFALGAGPGLVLLTLSVLRARHVGKHNRFRLPASAMCVAAIAPAAYHSALAGLACVTGVLGALVVVEVVYTRHVRRRAAAASPMRDDAGSAPRD